MILHHTLEATSLAIDCRDAVQRAGICCDLALSDEQGFGIRLESFLGEDLAEARTAIERVIGR